MKAEIRKEIVKIPTYKIAEPEKSPLFIEKRAYQGSTGKVYPFPVTEKIYDEKEEKEYNAIILENDYIYVMILPEIGGRIQRAFDKTNGYDFVYYNHVIKPALVGLAGPWISGGIEFNWPQHHRPSTFSPVDYSICENDDGSVSAFVGEVDRMYGTKGMAEIKLYPDKAYIEINGRLYNPTDYPQTFLWWANPAVAVNYNTFSVFPPDVNAVYDHGKRDVSTFPIATGEYYKYDYSAGVDISRYKNIKVPTSYMAAHSDYDFIGNYDEGREAGLLHIADHHISPGKKQWTWGCGDFGKMWDKNLTDEDGPYIELMTGVYTDNQPDFTWLKPQEEKTFTQYFMPYKSIGRVSDATKDAVVGVKDNEIRVYVTGVYNNAKITIICDGKEVYSKTVDLSPEKCFIDTVDNLKNYAITVLDENGRTLCKCKEYKYTKQPVPNPAKALESPENIASLEELYLAGQHLEQYRHATFLPADYYLEGLKRDKTDIRLNNAYGLLLLRNGQIKESIKHFKQAIEKQTWRNPNPYSGECYYNLGVAYEYLDENDKAYDAFYKSIWSSETQSQGFYHLACISVKNKEYSKALEFVNNSLIRNYHNMKARTLKAEIMSMLGVDNREFVAESYEIDKLSSGILYLLDEPIDRFVNYLDLSLDYMQFGLYSKAVEVLDGCNESNALVEYYKGYAYYLSGDIEFAKKRYKKAESMNSDYIFPNKVEEMLILENVISVLDSSPMACYYLGNLLYDKKQYEKAVYYWEKSVNQKPDFAMPYRNLSIAYYNKANNPQKALTAIEKACALEKDNSRFLLEKDQLSAKAGVSAKKRLIALEEHRNLLDDRDVLYLAYVTLLNMNERYMDALHCLENHTFHPWEGGEGKVSGEYKTALFALAENEMANGEYNKAIALYQKTLTYPVNLGEGKLENVPDNRAYYLIGKCYDALENNQKAKEYYILATKGSSAPAPVRYYNEQPSDYIYYQGLAFYELGERDKAINSFNQLISFGEEHINDKIEYDFFAVSMPELEVYQDDIQKRNDDYCRYLTYLGKKGLDEINI